jgi:hypothetical protein
MKFYIIGTNFDKYTILKSITKYIINELKLELEIINWFSKSDIDITKFTYDDIFIYVEIDKLFDSRHFMNIVKIDTKKFISIEFGKLVDKIKCTNSSTAEVVNDTDDARDTILSTKDIININNIDIPVTNKQDSNVSSLVGINVEINNQICFISRDDFIELSNLDIMLTKHGYKITEIIVE